MGPPPWGLVGGPWPQQPASWKGTKPSRVRSKSSPSLLLGRVGELKVFVQNDPNSHPRDAESLPSKHRRGIFTQHCLILLP